MSEAKEATGAVAPDLEATELAPRLIDAAAELAAGEATARTARQGEVLGAYALFGNAARRAARRWRLTGDAWEDIAAEAVGEALAGTAPVTAIEVGRLTRAVAARYGRRAEREVPTGDAAETTGEAKTGEDDEAPRKVGRSPRARMAVPHRADVYGVGEWSREAMRDPADVFSHRMDSLALAAAMNEAPAPTAPAERDAWLALEDSPCEALSGAYKPLHLATYRTEEHKPGDVVRWRRIEWAALLEDRAAQRALSRAARGWARDVMRLANGRADGWAARMARREVLRGEIRSHLEDEAHIGEAKLFDTAPFDAPTLTLPSWTAPAEIEALSAKQRRNWSALEAAEQRAGWALVTTRDVLAGPVAGEDGAGYLAALTVPSVQRAALAAATVREHWEAALEAQRALSEWRRRSEVEANDWREAKRARQFVANAPDDERQAAEQRAEAAEQRAATGARFVAAAEALAVAAAETLADVADTALSARRAALS